MSSIPASSHAHIKAKSKSKAPLKSGKNGMVLSRSHLLAMRDELDELAAIVAMMPQLQQFGATMTEIVGSRKGDDSAPSQDPLGSLLAELPRQQRAEVQKALDRTAGEWSVALAEEDRMDLTSAIHGINAVLHYRLKRLSALVARG